MGRNLLLKTVNADMTAHGGFVWPREGHVEAPDWNPKPVCGGGLHGLLRGCGEGCYLNWYDDAVWIVFEAHGEVVEFDGKAKCQTATVVYAGDRYTATQIILNEYGPVPCAGSTVVGGDHSTLIGGDGSTLTGGNYSKLTGGDYSTLIGGDNSTLTGGQHSTLVVGFDSTLAGGYSSTLIGGDGSTFTALVNSVFQSKYFDDISQRRRIAVAYVGENRIEPGVKYRAEKDVFVQVDD